MKFRYFFDRGPSLTDYGIFIICLGVTVFIYIYLKLLFLPVSIEINKNNQSIKDFYFNYRDLNKDGYSEQVIVGHSTNSPKEFILLKTFSGNSIEQFNVDGKILRDGVLYGNLDSDINDEIIIIYKTDNSIYLDVVDPQSLQYIKKKVKLIERPDSSLGDYWDVHLVVGSKIIDFDNDNETDLVFALTTGYAIYPRSIYLFNINQEKIISVFETSAPIQEMFIIDFDGDGQKEIIASSVATGNTTKKIGYHDRTSWLFYLSQKLTPKIKPISFGEYPTSNLILKTIFDEQTNQIIQVYKDDISKTMTLKIFNQKFVLEKEGRIESCDLIDIHTYTTDSNIEYFVTSKDQELLHLSPELRIINKVKVLVRDAIIVNTIDLNNDYSNEILISGTDGVSVYDKNLNLLAYSEIKLSNELYSRYFQLRKDGIGKDIQLAYVNGMDLIFKIKENNFHYLLYLIAIMVFVLSTILLLISKNLIKKFYLYLKSFIYFIYRGDAGYCLIDDYFQIQYYNKSFVESLRIQNINLKNQNINNTLSFFPDILESINASVHSKQPISGKVTINNPEFSFNGEIKIQPLKLIGNKVLAYLIELKNLTKPILDERAEIWGKSIQKIAHDIKTPLSTIALNLKAIQLKMEKEGIVNKEISNDIDVAKSEIERIKNLTKDFLKFVDLDTPNMQYIELNEIINSSIERFQHLIADNFKFDINLLKGKIFVWADPRQIEMAIHILVENAIDALQGSGLIAIETDLVQDLEREFVLISISDNGPGIKREMIDKIFEPHFSTKKDGTGMGLPFAKKIIKDHRGELALESKIELGTTFMIKLPIYKMKNE